MSSNSSSSDAIGNPLKLTDLIEDCLEHIFMYLDCDDLLRIAHTNKQLQPAAVVAFGRKAGKKTFRFHIANPHRSHVITNEFIDVYRLNTALSLLRCFGQSVAKLHIDTLHSATRKPIRKLNLVLRYTSEYCSESLVELHFCHIQNGVFDSVIIKPFIKVQSVEMIKCTLNADMANFNVLFPFLRRLDLIGNHFDDSVAVEKHFPRLEHLFILNGGQFPTKSIREILRLNPQLRSFSLERVYSPEYFRYVSKFLPKLDFLKVRGMPKDFGAFRDNVINFKVVKKVEIGFIYYDGTDQTMPTIKLAFDRLEDITLDLNMLSWDRALVDFLEKHQSIVSVTLRASDENTQAITENTLTEIVHALPLLNELNFLGVGFLVDDLYYLLNRFNLAKYSFHLRDPTQFNHLRIKLGNRRGLIIIIDIIKIRME